MDLKEILGTKSKKDDIAACFVIRNGKMLIGLRNYKASEWKDFSVWTVPGGHCEEGETFEDTLRREALEECDIKELQITSYLGVVKGAKEGDTVYVFMGKTDEEPKLMEPDNFSEWKWCEVSDIPSNFINTEALKLINH